MRPPPEPEACEVWPYQSPPAYLSAHPILAGYVLCQRERNQRMAGGDGNMLFPVAQIGDRIGENRSARRKPPERLPGRRIEGEKVAFVGDAENQSPGSGKHAA